MLRVPSGLDLPVLGQTSAERVCRLSPSLSPLLNPDFRGPQKPPLEVAHSGCSLSASSSHAAYLDKV